MVGRHHHRRMSFRTIEATAHRATRSRFIHTYVHICTNNHVQNDTLFAIHDRVSGCKVQNNTISHTITRNTLKPKHTLEHQSRTANGRHAELMYTLTHKLPARMNVTIVCSMSVCMSRFADDQPIQPHNLTYITRERYQTPTCVCG